MSFKSANRSFALVYHSVTLVSHQGVMHLKFYGRQGLQSLADFIRLVQRFILSNVCDKMMRKGETA